MLILSVLIENKSRNGQGVNGVLCVCLTVSKQVYMISNWENQCTDHLMTDELRREEGEPLPLSVADVMETLVWKVLK